MKKNGDENNTNLIDEREREGEKKNVSWKFLCTLSDISSGTYTLLCYPLHQVSLRILSPSVGHFYYLSKKNFF